MSGALTMLITAYQLSPGRILAQSPEFAALEKESHHYLLQQEKQQQEQEQEQEQQVLQASEMMKRNTTTQLHVPYVAQELEHNKHNSRDCQLTPAALSLLESSPIAPQSLEFHSINLSQLTKYNNNNQKHSQLQIKEQEEEQELLEEQHKEIEREHQNKTSSSGNSNITAWRSFYSLLRIAIPSWKSREAQTITCQHLLLLLRVVVSVFVSRMYAKLGKTILSGNKQHIIRMIVYFALLSVPASLLDASLNYLNELLQLYFRENLTKYLSKRYLTEKVFYRLATLPSAALGNSSNNNESTAVTHNVVTNTRLDQRITDDVQRWSVVTAFASTSFTRPLIEAITFSFLMFRRTGLSGPLLTWTYYILYAVMSLAWSPNREQLVEQRMERKAALQAAQQRLITFNEEVSLLRGFDFERAYLQQLTDNIANQAYYAAFVLARFNLFETLYTKYGSVIVSYAVGALGLMHAHRSSAMLTQQNITTTTINNNNNELASIKLEEANESPLMLAHYSELTFIFRTLAKAISRVLYNIKLASVINGYTCRLSDLKHVMEHVTNQVQRQHQYLLEADRNNTLAKHVPSQEKPLFGNNGNYTKQYEQVEQNKKNNYNDNDLKTTTTYSHGITIRDEFIEFVDVPIITPTGECLCKALSFYVKPGMNLLVVGPNGCGKTSMFRILGELWPLHGGMLRVPEQSQMYYVPQRPYMYDGTLYEQILYPTSQRAVQVSENDLYKIMQMANLAYLLDKPDIDWHTHLNWFDDTLSMGEKQRLAMARLFYHRPRFAILDECSSCLDCSVEQQLYKQCAQLGITVITIAHRRSAWKYHNWVLEMNGNGGYVFGPLLIRKEEEEEKEEIDEEVLGAVNSNDAELENDDSSSSSSNSNSENTLPDVVNADKYEIKEQCKEHHRQNVNKHMQETSSEVKTQENNTEHNIKAEIPSQHYNNNNNDDDTNDNSSVLHKTVMYIPCVIKSSDKTCIGEEHIVKVLTHHHHHHHHCHYDNDSRKHNLQITKEEENNNEDSDSDCSSESSDYEEDGKSDKLKVKSIVDNNDNNNNSSRNDYSKLQNVKE